MKNLIERLKRKMGRLYVCYAFDDLVTGKAVNYYTDGKGNFWMATGTWSSIRVEVDFPHPGLVSRAKELGYAD